MSKQKSLKFLLISHEKSQSRDYQKLSKKTNLREKYMKFSSI